MRSNDIKAPFLKYDDIRPIATKFLHDYNPDDTIPVPIEKITEFKLKITIIPTPNLQQLSGVVGWLSKDCSIIHVDYYVYDHIECRYYFTLAHEIGHSILHRDIFNSLEFDNVDEWTNITEICPIQYGFIEQQAYNFAGLVLVPENHLKHEYFNALSIVKNIGFDVEKNKEMVDEYVCNMLQKIFNVSTQTILKRIQYDKL